MLQLLERLDTLRFVHRDVGTRAELIHYINLWLDGDRSVEDYFVLYLAFHGTKRRQRGRTSTSVWISDADDGQVTLSELADVLGSNLVDVVIHFGSCWTMAADTGYLTDFVKRTKVKAVAGYTKPVDWVQSAAMDLLFFDRISRDTGRAAASDAIYKDAAMQSRLKTSLGFEIFPAQVGDDERAIGRDG